MTNAKSKTIALARFKRKVFTKSLKNTIVYP